MIISHKYKEVKCDKKQFASVNMPAKNCSEILPKKCLKRKKNSMQTKDNPTRSYAITLSSIETHYLFGKLLFLCAKLPQRLGNNAHCLKIRSLVQNGKDRNFLSLQFCSAVQSVQNTYNIILPSKMFFSSSEVRANVQFPSLSHFCS